MEPQPVNNTKTILIVVITALVTTLVVGSGVFAWQQRVKQKEIQQAIEKEKQNIAQKLPQGPENNGDQGLNLNSQEPYVIFGSYDDSIKKYAIYKFNTQSDNTQTIYTLDWQAGYRPPLLKQYINNSFLLFKDLDHPSNVDSLNSKGEKISLWIPRHWNDFHVPSPNQQYFFSPYDRVTHDFQTSESISIPQNANEFFGWMPDSSGFYFTSYTGTNDPVNDTKLLIFDIKGKKVIDTGLLLPREGNKYIEYKLFSEYNTIIKTKSEAGEGLFPPSSLEKISLTSKQAELLLNAEGELYSNPYMLSPTKIIVNAEKYDRQSNHIVIVDSKNKVPEEVLDNSSLISLSANGEKILLRKQLGKKADYNDPIYWMDLQTKTLHFISSGGDKFNFVGWFGR